MTRPILLLLLLGVAACTQPGPEISSRGTRRSSTVPARDLASELWSLGPQDATLALVATDLRPLALAAGNLRTAALAAPRGAEAVHHLEIFFRAFCPTCIREGRSFMDLGIDPAEGFALFASPRERVLAFGGPREEPLLALMEAIHRRFDHTIQRRSLVRASGRLEVLDGLYPWYCKKPGARLVCGSSPAALDAALARKPGPPDLFARRIAPRLPVKRGDHLATLWLESPLAPDLVGLTVAPDRIALRVLSRPLPSTMTLLSRSGPASLLPILEEVEGLLRVNLPWAELDALIQEKRSELGKLDIVSKLSKNGKMGKAGPVPSTAASEPLAGSRSFAKELRENLQGEVLLAKTGPFRFALVARLKNPAKMKPQLELLERGLKVMQFAQRFAQTGPVRISAVEAEPIEGQSALAVTVEVQLGEVLNLPIPLPVSTKLYAAVGPDAFVASNDLPLVRRVLNPALRKPALPALSADEAHLAQALSPAAIFALHSKTLDPFSGIPRPLLDAWALHVLKKDRNLLDLLEAARFVADLSLDLAAWVRPRRDLVEAEVVFRPLHLEDAPHAAARGPFLKALRARHAGDLEGLRRSLTEVMTAHGKTRYGARAKLLLGRDPSSLVSLVTGLAVLAASRPAAKARPPGR